MPLILRIQLIDTDTTPPTVLNSKTVPNAALTLFDQYRQMVTDPNDSSRPRYQTVWALILGTLLENLVKPALSAIPTPGILAAGQQFETARQALETAKNQALNDSLT